MHSDSFFGHCRSSLRFRNRLRCTENSFSNEQSKWKQEKKKETKEKVNKVKEKETEEEKTKKMPFREPSAPISDPSSLQDEGSLDEGSMEKVLQRGRGVASIEGDGKYTSCGGQSDK